MWPDAVAPTTTKKGTTAERGGGLHYTRGRGREVGRERRHDCGTNAASTRPLGSRFPLRRMLWHWACHLHLNLLRSLLFQSAVQKACMKFSSRVCLECMETGVKHRNKVFECKM
jgi:hypothetical protein